MSHLLDDDFFGFEDYKAALSDKDRDELNGKVPYSVLKGATLADVCALLEEAGLDYALQRQEGSTNGTGIIPLASTQLDMVNTLVYIKLEERPQADQLVAQYEAKIAAAPPKENSTGTSTSLYITAVVFLLLLLIFTYISGGFAL